MAQSCAGDWLLGRVSAIVQICEDSRFHQGGGSTSPAQRASCHGHRGTRVPHRHLTQHGALLLACGQPHGVGTPGMLANAHSGLGGGGWDCQSLTSTASWEG